VGKLHARRAAEAVQKIGDALELRDLRIEPQPVAARRDPSLLGDRRRFDENKTGAAEREASEMNQVKIIGEAVTRNERRCLSDRRWVDRCEACTYPRLRISAKLNTSMPMARAGMTIQCTSSRFSSPRDRLALSPARDDRC
jgi:hypothetical protein